MRSEQLFVFALFLASPLNPTFARYKLTSRRRFPLAHIISCLVLCIVSGNKLFCRMFKSTSSQE
jgi:hypothetical protein